MLTKSKSNLFPQIGRLKQNIVINHKYPLTVMLSTYRKLVFKYATLRVAWWGERRCEECFISLCAWLIELGWNRQDLRRTISVVDMVSTFIHFIELPSTDYVGFIDPWINKYKLFLKNEILHLFLNVSNFPRIRGQPARLWTWVCMMLWSIDIHFQHLALPIPMASSSNQKKRIDNRKF